MGMRKVKDMRDLLRLIKVAEGNRKPKVLYKEAKIERNKGQDYVVIDGVKFSSRLLRAKPGLLGQGIPLISVPAGRELYDWAKVHWRIYWSQYWMDKIIGGGPWKRPYSPFQNPSEVQLRHAGLRIQYESPVPWRIGP